MYAGYSLSPPNVQQTFLRHRPHVSGLQTALCIPVISAPVSFQMYIQYCTVCPCFLSVSCFCLGACANWCGPSVPATGNAPAYIFLVSVHHYVKADKPCSQLCNTLVHHRSPFCILLSITVYTPGQRCLYTPCSPLCIPLITPVYTPFHYYVQYTPVHHCVYPCSPLCIPLFTTMYIVQYTPVHCVSP
jgi:hypothetical protein